MRLFILSVLFFAFLGFFQDFVKISKEIPEVRLGLNPWPGYALFWLARDLGYFEQEGLNVRLFTFMSLEDSLVSYQNKDIDFLCTTQVEVALNHLSFDTSLAILYALDWSNGGDQILASQTIEELKRKKELKIGFEPLSVHRYMVQRFLEKHGISSEAAQWISLSGLSVTQEIRKGYLDLVSSYPPDSFHILKETGWKVIFDSSQIPGEILDVLAARSSFLRQNPDIAPRLIRAWNRACTLYRQNPFFAKKIIQKYLHMSDQEMEQSFQWLHFVDATEQKMIREKVLNSGFMNDLAPNSQSLWIWPEIRVQ